MEDVRVMRQTTVGQTSTAVGTTEGPFVPASPTRVALVIDAPRTNRVTLSWGGAAVLDQGVTLYPAGPPLLLDLQKHGAMVTQPVRAIADTAAETMTYVETLLNKT